MQNSSLGRFVASAGQLEELERRAFGCMARKEKQNHGLNIEVGCVDSGQLYAVGRGRQMDQQ